MKETFLFWSRCFFPTQTEKSGCCLITVNMICGTSSSITGERQHQSYYETYRWLYWLWLFNTFSDWLDHYVTPCYAKYCVFLQHGTFVNKCCFIRAAKANKKPVLVHKGMVKSLLYQVSKHQGIFLWDKLYKHISTDPWWNPLPPRQLGATQVCQILLPQTKQMMLTCLWCLETWNPPTFLWWARALREEGSRLQIWVLPGFLELTIVIFQHEFLFF